MRICVKIGTIATENFSIVIIVVVLRCAQDAGDNDFLQLPLARSKVSSFHILNHSCFSNH